MRKGYLLMALALILGACATTTTTDGDGASAQKILFEAEATYTGALAGAGTYLNLPDCEQAGATICKDKGVADKILLATESAAMALSTAETLILGCTKEQYVAATATPPTGTCGSPGTDQMAREQAITAVKAAVAALQVAVSIIQAVGG